MAFENYHKRHLQLLRRFGLSIDDYNAMHVAQAGVCAVCQQMETALDSRTQRPIALAVDHDHETGKVRGLLCSRCNRAIGYMQDNPKIMLAAAGYILRHRQKESTAG